ncbi:MAG: hypothetical protein C4583_12845 [Anaerolineaceae bacterium]|nr:MAG: hypothetical protein C4583_12845 [Anaerolineaceae bacterium]
MDGRLKKWTCDDNVTKRVFGYGLSSLRNKNILQRSHGDGIPVLTYKVHADLLALTIIFLYTEFNRQPPTSARDTASPPNQVNAAAMTWFGAPDPTAGSPWNKGEWLAELLRMTF